MKKLLATLLVAAMLMSCMAVVSFAAGSTAYTSSTYPLAEMGTANFDDNQWQAQYSDLTSFYTTNYTTVTGVGGNPNTKKKAPIYKAMSDLTTMGIDMTNSEDAVGGPFSVTLPTTVNATNNDSLKPDYVLFPVYGGGDGLFACSVYFDYDEDLLEPVTSVKYGFDNVTIKNGELFANWAKAGDKVGLIGAVAFKVKADAVGNASGDATTTISFGIGTDGNCTSKANGAATLTGTSMTVNLVGLTPGAAEEPEEIADAAGVEAAMPAAEVKAFSATVTDVEADVTWLSDNGSKVVSGDDQGVDLTDGNYQVTFGTADFTGKVAPVEYGFALYANDELKGYYAAKKVIEGKFGILFFGLKEGVTYTTKSYVKYDGEAPIVAD